MSPRKELPGVPVTPLVLIFAIYALSMFKIDHEPLHTLICTFEYIWTKEGSQNLLSVVVQRKRQSLGT